MGWNKIYKAYTVDFNMPEPLARADIDGALPTVGDTVLAVCLEDREDLDRGFGCLATVSMVIMPQDFYYAEDEPLADHALLVLDIGAYDGLDPPNPAPPPVTVPAIDFDTPTGDKSVETRRNWFP